MPNLNLRHAKSAQGRRVHSYLCALCVSAVNLLAMIAFASPAHAAESTASPASAKDPLTSKQQIVRDRMIQLEDRMFRLTEKLAKAEPEQAKRLEGALRQARELLIRRHMEETMALLEAGKLPDAADR